MSCLDSETWLGNWRGQLSDYSVWKHLLHLRLLIGPCEPCYQLVSQSQYRTCYASEVVLTPSGPTTDKHARLSRRYISATAPKRQTKDGSAVLLQTMYFSTMLQSHSHLPPLTGCSELFPACPAARRHAVAASVTVRGRSPGTHTHAEKHGFKN